MKHLTKTMFCILLVAAVTLSCVGCGLNPELLNRIKEQQRVTIPTETEGNADYQKKLDEILNPVVPVETDSFEIPEGITFEDGPTREVEE